MIKIKNCNVKILKPFKKPHQRSMLQVKKVSIMRMMIIMENYVAVKSINHREHRSNKPNMKKRDKNSKKFNSKNLKRLE
jgi:hypothetical protein